MSKWYIKAIIAMLLITALAALPASCKSDTKEDGETQPGQDIGQSTEQAPAAAGAEATESAETAATTTVAKSQAAGADSEPSGQGAAKNALPLSTWLCSDTATLSLLTRASVVNDAPPPSNDLAKYKEFERMTNVHIEFEVIQNDEYDQALISRLAAGGDLPDILGYIGGVNRLPEFVSRGRIIDQTGLWESRYKYTHALIDGSHQYSDPMYAALYETMAVNGVFYGVNQISPIRHNQVGLMINKFWQEELGLPDPETVDDLYDILVAFRDMDATGGGGEAGGGEAGGGAVSGGAGGRIPLVTEGDCLLAIANYFGLELGGGANSQGFSAAGGKLVFERTDDKFRAYLAYISKLYKEKLLDNGYETADRNTLNNYAAENKCGVINWWIQAMDTFSAYSPYSGNGYNTGTEVFKPLKPLKSEFGGGCMYNRRSGAGNLLLISASCNTPEIAADWTDFIFASPYGMDVVAYGVPGESYNKAGDKIEILRDENGIWKRAAVGGGQQPYAYIEANNNYTFAQAPEWKVAAWKSLEPYYKDGTVNNLVLLPEETDVIVSKCSGLASYADQVFQAYVAGKLDTGYDSTWAQYLEYCGNYGLRTYLDTYQKAYDRTRR